MPIGKKIRKYTRILHRDIGYLLVGLTLIYGISGIILNFKKKGIDPAYKEIVIKSKIKAGLSIRNLSEDWEKLVKEAPELTKVFDKGEVYHIYIKGGSGQYYPHTGELSYMVYSERPFVRFINEIHYNTAKRFTWIATIFAAAFIFLALSGLIMINGKNGFLRRGVYFVVIGIIIPVLWYLFT